MVSNFARSQKIQSWNRENMGICRICKKNFEKIDSLLGRSKVEKYVWGKLKKKK